MKERTWLNPILILLAGVGIGGAVGAFAMSLAAASKVEPPLIEDKNMTINQNKAEETSEDEKE